MKAKHKVILLSAVLGIFTWVIDAALDSMFFFPGPFLKLLLTDIPAHEIYIRSFVLLIFILFGIIISRVISNRDRMQEITKALLNASQAVMKYSSFEESARVIFEKAKKITGGTAGYVALLSDDGEENEVLFLDAGGRPCSVDESLPMPIRGLREVSYREHKAVYENDFMTSEWIKFMPEGHVAMKNVMFAPLNIEGKTVGIMGLANKVTDFNDHDAEMASAFAEFAAIALSNSRNLDKLKITVAQLQTSLAEIKTLKGILPICANCKKIRDDDGYWQRLEKYFHDHTEVNFTHGICPDCIKELYPEMDRKTDQSRK